MDVLGAADGGGKVTLEDCRKTKNKQKMKSFKIQEMFTDNLNGNTIGKKTLVNNSLSDQLYDPKYFLRI